MRRGEFNLGFWLTFAGLVLIVSLAAIYLFLAQQSPLPFPEADFNRDGIVTFTELRRAGSHAARPTSRDSQTE